MRIKPIYLFLIALYSFLSLSNACEEREATRNSLPIISAVCEASQTGKDDQFYLILSVRSPAKIPLHQILSDIKPEKLLLIAGEKYFSESEKQSLSPSFNTIGRVPDYRDSGNLEVVAYNLYKEKSFHKIIAYHEYDLLRAARLREFFGLDGQTCQSALAFRNKILMKDILQKQWSCKCGCIMDSELAQAYQEASRKCAEECRKQILSVSLPFKSGKQTKRGSL